MGREKKRKGFVITVRPNIVCEREAYRTEALVGLWHSGAESPPRILPVVEEDCAGFEGDTCCPVASSCRVRSAEFSQCVPE